MTKNLLAYEFKEEAVKQVSPRLNTSSRIDPGPGITFLSCVVQKWTLITGQVDK